MSVCLSIYLSNYLSARVSQKPQCPNFTKFSVHVIVWPWLGPSLTIVQCVMNFRVVEDVVFSHNRPHGAWRWQYRVECSAGSIHNFKAYSPGGATLFDFVVVYDGSNLRTGGKLLSTIASLRYCNDFRVLTTHIGISGFHGGIWTTYWQTQTVGILIF